MTQHTVEDMMVAYAQDAVDYAKQRFEVSLDYSEGSVQLVEAMLGQIHNAIPKSFAAKLIKKAPPKEAVEQIWKMFGGYIGEVMRKHWGWQLDT